jgi:DNA-binding transcriptional LysR family regulator
METASIEVIEQYGLCGIGVSFLPMVVIRRELEAGALKCTPWQTTSSVVIQMIRHKDK